MKDHDAHTTPLASDVTSRFTTQLLGPLPMLPERLTSHHAHGIQIRQTQSPCLVVCRSPQQFIVSWHRLRSPTTTRLSNKSSRPHAHPAPAAESKLDPVVIPLQVHPSAGLASSSRRRSPKRLFVSLVLNSLSYMFAYFDVVFAGHLIRFPIPRTENGYL